MLGTPPTQSQEPRRDPARSECSAAHSRRDRCGVPPRAWLLGGEQLWPCPLAVPGAPWSSFLRFHLHTQHSFSARGGAQARAARRVPRSQRAVRVCVCVCSLANSMEAAAEAEGPAEVLRARFAHGAAALGGRGAAGAHRQDQRSLCLSLNTGAIARHHLSLFLSVSSARAALPSASLHSVVGRPPQAGRRPGGERSLPRSRGEQSRALS